MEGNWSGKRVAVIGGTGFIGSHLTRALIGEGATVTITSRAGNNAWRLSDCTGYMHEALDVTDERAVATFMEKNKPEYLYYLAAVLPGSRPRPDVFEKINAEGVKHVLTAVDTASLKSAVVMGTASEYGPVEIPTVEDTPEKPEDPYGISKLHATQYARTIGAERGIRTTVFRSPATYGSYEGFATFIPQCILACLEKRPFEMSGEQEMDFLYVGDLVQALLSAGMRERGNMVEVINISNGTTTKLASVALAIGKTLDAEKYLKIGAIPVRPFERTRRVLSIVKARELLGWIPKADLIGSVTETALWYKNHPELIPLLKQPTA